MSTQNRDEEQTQNRDEEPQPRSRSHSPVVNVGNVDEHGVDRDIDTGQVQYL